MRYFDSLYGEKVLIDSLYGVPHSFEWFILEGLFSFCEVGTNISYLPAHYSFYDMEYLWELLYDMVTAIVLA